MPSECLSLFSDVLINEMCRVADQVKALLTSGEEGGGELGDTGD